MAWTIRHQIKRKFKQAVGNVETAQLHLLDCLNTYKAQGGQEGSKGYPTEEATCDILMQVLEQAKGLIVDAGEKL